MVNGILLSHKFDFSKIFCYNIITKNDKGEIIVAKRKYNALKQIAGTQKRKATNTAVDAVSMFLWNEKPKRNKPMKDRYSR